MEQQQDEPERGEQLERRAGSSTSAMPGVFGPKMTPASMKNGIVGSPTVRPSRARTPAARNAPPRATSWSPTSAHHVVHERAQVLLAADHDEPIAGAQHFVGSGATIGSDPRRIAATVIFVRRRISSSAMLRPAAGDPSCSVTQSMSSVPTTASISSTIAGWKYAPESTAPRVRACVSVSVSDARGSPPPRGST